MKFSIQNFLLIVFYMFLHVFDNSNAFIHSLLTTIIYVLGVTAQLFLSQPLQHYGSFTFFVLTISDKPWWEGSRIPNSATKLDSLKRHGGFPGWTLETFSCSSWSIRNSLGRSVTAGFMRLGITFGIIFQVIYQIYSRQKSHLVCRRRAC